MKTKGGRRREGRGKRRREKDREDKQQRLLDAYLSARHDTEAGPANSSPHADSRRAG
jgi:hypothetical protein